MPSKAPKIYSTDPEALKRANPNSLTEAERAYRESLLKQDAEYLKQRYGEAYLIEIASGLSRQKVYMTPHGTHVIDEHDKPAKPVRTMADALDIFK